MKPLIFILLLLCPVLGTAQTDGTKGKGKATQSNQDDVVVVRASQTLTLTNEIYTFRKLIMEDNAKLALKNPLTTIIIDSAYFGKWCIIDGQGADGQDGKKGQNGMDYGTAPNLNNGRKGVDGISGKNGVDLQLAMTVLEQATPIRILLNGGDGGDGGNGGNGGWRTARCGAKTTGATGGNGGNAAKGGDPGTLKVLAQSPFDGPIYSLVKKTGSSGKPGLGGYPGRIKKVSCPTRSQATVVEGKSGNKGTPYFAIRSGSPNGGMENINFPAPPPEPSDRINIPLTANKFATLKNLDAWLSTALRESGYDGKFSYLNYPGGYALVTRIERIHQNGTAFENDRFNPTPEFVTEFSLRALIEAFLNPTKGYFRLIAFIITDESTGNSQEKISREDAMAWFSGNSILHADIGRKPIRTGHKVEVLIYEFSVSENGQKPVKVDPIRLEAKEHLLRATLWDRLNRR